MVAASDVSVASERCDFDRPACVRRSVLARAGAGIGARREQPPEVSTAASAPAERETKIIPAQPTPPPPTSGRCFLCFAGKKKQPTLPFPPPRGPTASAA